MSNPSDDNLVRAALGGDAEAFCALLRRYQERVYGVTLAILADFHLAWDAAQQAFLCAYCDLPKLKDQNRFGAWLCGIARNTAFEVLRSEQRHANWPERCATVTRCRSFPHRSKSC